ncbi:MAG TPA: MFS transporter [Streptosporangiaceae bacterium]|nr:MFS transporter [Streptosporangiaceae bacterium]
MSNARIPVRLISRLMVDITPLRESPDFRRLWAGGGLSGLGGQMTSYAVILQVYQLTRSSLAVGMVGLFIAVALIAVSVLGGAIVDATDRRRTVLVATSVQAVVSAALAAQAFAGLGQVWLLYCLVAVQSAVAGVNTPAQRTFIPSLLPREQLPAGAALQMVTMYITLLAGPALAGLITAAFQLKICYLVDAVSFAFSLYAVARLPVMRPAGQNSTRGLRAIGEGLRFIARTRAILGVFLADMSATFLGMPFALFPAINAERFGGHPQTLGLMTTAVAAGGLAGSALSGPAGRIGRPGLGMLVAGAVWGAGLVAFGLAGSFWLAFLTLIVAGAADVTSVVLRTALIQSLTPDRLLGRVSAADLAVGAGVPQLGNFRAGAVASLTSPTISAVSGGLATVAGTALIGLLVPGLVTFRTARPLPSQAPA